MKLSCSNIALPSYRHEKFFDSLAAMGFGGLEVAPSRVWNTTGDMPTRKDVEAYRRSIEASGLTVVGLHSLTWGIADVALFDDASARHRLLELLMRQAQLCSDLGGHTLVFGSPQSRRRGRMSEDEAMLIATDFFGELARRTADIGVVFCLEPLSPSETDFVCSAWDALALVRQVDHPGFLIQLDAKSIFASAEADEALFAECASSLVHFHANSPGLGLLEADGGVDHQKLGNLLAGIEYEGWVSLEQRMLDEENPVEPIRRSHEVMARCYR